MRDTHCHIDFKDFDEDRESVIKRAQDKLNNVIVSGYSNDSNMDVLKLSKEGVAVTFISSEIQEMLNVCTRLVVMKDRNIVGELKDEQLTQSNIMKTIAGGK